ncbi:50S ribosomal protein L22 [Athalassotoga saccharophila]|uniref:50S ribosomal protein L22 n=1 Tax=Athalassotoga saccharophila TaxID=1441386 RepID=UPI0030882200|nr:50S ribosomal protein L22 [Athalassotoga saccharophila]
MTEVKSMAEDKKRVKRSVFHRERKASAPEPIEAIARGRYLRISPYKVRSILNTIRGKNVSQALQILEFANTKSAKLVQKILNSAIANAQNNFKLDVDSLYVARCMADDAPRLKRLNPMARGRASMMLKRLSHITIVVRDRSKEAELKSPKVQPATESEVQ